mgnify:CR=1 FL=1
MKKKPKGLQEFNTNEEFRKTMREIIKESKTYHSGSSISNTELINSINNFNFGMRFQEFIDSWCKEFDEGVDY